MDNQEERFKQLAKDILAQSRNKLLFNLRFMDMALSQFEWIPVSNSTFLCDGKHIFYNPYYLLHNYKKEVERPVHDYLHIVMHSVFCHMFFDASLDRKYWNIACDIAVEGAILDLNLKCVSVQRDDAQREYILKLKEQIKFITAEKVYAYLKDKYTTEKELNKIAKLFYVDDHKVWYMILLEIELEFGVSLTHENDKDRQSDDREGAEQRRKEMATEWKDIAQRMQVDLETFSRKHGDKAGTLSQNLTAVTREKYDYSEFLKKYAVMGEAMKINDDEFDYIFYTYGLKLYEKMPLIEPLEYKDIKMIKEFVIAIDTSGSTSGDLVKKFVQKTYNILKSTESFFKKVNIHIIQCDAEIQEAVKITNQKEMEEYIQNMTIHGLGGTDFTPVFDYVDKLIKNKEFSNLKGLLYFTDGEGTFPSKKPSYNTAFVFVDDEYNVPEVPTWAVKLILQSNEI